jgi:excisionase family DNA binding protein
VTVPELAASLRVNQRHVFRLVHEGHLPKPFQLRPGGRWLWRADELRRFLDAKRPEAIAHGA